MLLLDKRYLRFLGPGKLNRRFSISSSYSSTGLSFNSSSESEGESKSEVEQMFDNVDNDKKFSIN